MSLSYKEDTRRIHAHIKIADPVEDKITFKIRISNKFIVFISSRSSENAGIYVYIAIINCFSHFNKDIDRGVQESIRYFILVISIVIKSNNNSDVVYTIHYIYFITK